MRKIKTIKDMQSVAKSRGGECLSTEYKNNHTKLIWKCSKGHIWETPYRGIQHGTWCPKCHLERIQNNEYISQEMFEIINGELLGDGHLYKYHKSVSYAHSSMYKKYMEYIKYLFEKNRLSFRFWKENNTQRQYHGYSKGYTNLYNLYDKWYKSKNNKLIKIVPKDLQLTPTILKHWFIGDGHKNIPDKGRNYIRIFLSTQGFTKKEVKYLQNELLSKCSIKSNIYQSTPYTKPNNYKGDGYYIIISKKENIKRFYNYIGECPKEIESIYGYKWPTNKETEYINR